MVGRALHDDQRATDDDAPQSPRANTKYWLTTRYDGATPPAPPRLSLSNWSIRFKRCRSFRYLVPPLMSCAPSGPSIFCFWRVSGGANGYYPCAPVAAPLSPTSSA